MLQPTFFTTETKNNYVYSFLKNYILNSHPLIKYFYQNENISTIDKIYKKLINEKRYSTTEIDYYKSKYEFLKKNGFMQAIGREPYVTGQITSDNIEYELANLLNLVFEITERCNLNCAYCFYGDDYSEHDERLNNDLHIDDAKVLNNFLTSKWTSKNNFSISKIIHVGFYGGEPLLNFKFIKTIVRYLKTIENKTQLKFRFVMTSNSVLLDKYMDFLVKHDFLLTISLDGDKYANSYRTFKNKKESFNKVLENIKLLQKKYPSYFNKRVSFNAVLHDRNEYLNTFRFIKNNFNKSVRGSTVNPLISNDKFKHRIKQFNLNKKDELQCFLASGEPLHYNMFLRNYSEFHFEDYDDVYYFEQKKYYFPTGTCRPFSKRLFVTEKGKVLPCETIGHQFALGTVINKKVELDSQKIADTYNAYFNEIRKRCNTCYRVKFCTECLFLNIIKQSKIKNCNYINNEGHSKL